MGSTEGDKVQIGIGQIAVRGPLIALASRGVAGKTDALDGVHILDGRARPVGDSTSRRVRIIPSPHKPGMADGGTDAVGVAIDGDFVVFGTYSGLVTKRRLDGREVWTVPSLPPGSRPGLPALIDVNGDKVLDAIVPVIPMVDCAVATACGAAWETMAVALNGKDGATLWTIGGGMALRTSVGWTPPRGCINTLISSIPEEKQLALGCFNGNAGSKSSHTEFSTWRFLLDGKGPIPSRQMTEPLLGFGIRPLLVSGLTPNGRNHVHSLTVVSDGLLVNDEEAPVAEPQALLFDVGGRAPVRLPPSIGDIDDDGIWDVLVTVGDSLHVLSTGSRENAQRTLWRTDLQASGAPSHALDVPAQYAARVGARDVTRWLRPDVEATASAFQPLGEAEIRASGGLEGFQLEPLGLPSVDDGDGLGITAETQCFGSLRERGDGYALNEGTLVVSRTGRWVPVDGSPWPLVGLSCANGRLRLLAVDERQFSLRVPTPWYRQAIVALMLVFSGLVGVLAYAGRQTPQGMGHAGHKATLEHGSVRNVVLSDVPLTEKGRAHSSQKLLLEGLVGVLDNKDTQSPVTVALYGPWGSGKSSAMRMLSAELQATGRYIDVWFNAWRFHREKELAGALLQSIVDEVGKRTDWITRIGVLWNRIRNASGRDILLVFAPVLAVGLLVALALRTMKATAHSSINGTALVALFVGAVYRIGEPLFKVFSLDPAKLLASGNSKRRIEFVREFPSEFQRITTQLPQDTRLILFIDDLDRCPPDRIVDVLETLSMLADTGCGFFVLAIDPMTVRRAIELKYADLLKVARRERSSDTERFGLRYLEKMVTLGINVPLIPAAETSLIEQSEEADQPRRWLAWARAHLLPKPPFAITVLLLSAAIPALVYFRTEAGELLDSCYQALTAAEPKEKAPAPSSSVSAPAPSSSAPATATTAQPPAPSASSALAPPRPSTSASAAAPVVTPPPATQPSATPAPAPARVLTPKLVSTRDAVPPVDGLWVGTALRLALWVSTGFALLAAVGIVLSERKRRKKIRSARPMSKDSKAFTDALTEIKKTLPANPREAIRFTNSARFLYEVVRREQGDRGWEPAFFTILEARWRGKADPEVPAWLVAQMDRWMPRDAPVVRTPHGPGAQ